MKKKLSFLLAAVLLLGCLFTGCGDQEASYGTKLDNKYLIENGNSNYVIVLPESPREDETLAAEELALFLGEASGCTLETVSEKAVPSGSKYISLGRTSQFFSAFSEDDLTATDGTLSTYFIGSKDDNIYIAGSQDYKGECVLYGVYDLLHDLIGYTYYHDTEIDYVKSSNVNLWSYKKHIVSPSFDMRTHSTRYIYGNHLHNDRLRYINFSQGGEWDAITNGHSQVSVFMAPRDEDENGVRYGTSHPEWFVDPTATGVGLNDNQLCWTAGGDPESLDLLQTLIAEEMFTYIMMDNKATFFMLGQQDNGFVCNCAGCQKALEEWGGSACGLQIDFVNGVIEKTEAMLDEQAPDREVLYAIYAYKPTQQAPVKKNADGTYSPYSDRVIPHEKMRIFFAPVLMNFGFAYDSPMNEDVYADLQGWDAVCNKEQLMVYTYDLNIFLYFVNFFNLGTVQSHMQTYEEMGVSYLLSQGVSDGRAPCFDELRAYCISNLMWDTSRNFEELAEDFIQHYYKDAAEAMQGYYDMIVDQSAYYLGAVDPGSGVATGITNNSTCYPRAFVEKLDVQIQQAMEAISHLENEDSELYALLKARIMKEYLTNIYLKMNHYKDFYSETEISEMKEIWDTYIAYWQITGVGEGYALPDLF